ncbi:uncharacterized protein LOC117118976 isoform X2 [Anneissia japonica]|uniref:uncharacterized protein LOC117118976 isoform X2 n=1 Tax=Anneissia japonica TaxID=1529436 RepID=UPI0014255557|nr:uncharacterized protein LOC117118976 isoform X2 [Anneissia japonica]
MPSNGKQEKERDIKSKEEQTKASDTKVQVKEDVKDQKDVQDEMELIRFEKSCYNMPSDGKQEKVRDINSKEEQESDTKMQIKEDIKDQKDVQDEMKFIKLEKSCYDMFSDGKQEKERDINSKEEQASDTKMQIKEDIKDQNDVQDEMKLIRLAKSYYDMPSGGKQEKERDIISKEEQASNTKMQIKEDVQDEVELIRLEKSFYDMPSDGMQKKEEFSSKEEQADDEKIQIKEDIKAEKDQSLSDLLRDLGILGSREGEDKTSGTGNKPYSCSDVPQKSEATGIISIAGEENASDSNLLTHNEQYVNKVAGAISCNQLEFASTKCEETNLMWGLDNITKYHEHLHSRESASSSPNSSHLLDFVSNEQEVFQETRYCSSDDCQIDVCLKELKEGTATVGLADERNDNGLKLKDHRDNQKIISPIVTPDGKNTDNSLLKQGYRKDDHMINECDRIEKGKESSMTPQSRNTSSACSMDEVFDKIISNLVDDHQPDANSSDEAVKADKPKQMKDLITFSDSEDSDSYVSRWVSGVISKQLVNLQEEIFGRTKQHQSVIDIDGSSVDPVLTTSHTSVLPEMEVCQLKELAFNIDIGPHTSNNEVDKHPSDDIYAVMHPAVDGKHLSDVNDGNSKHLAVNGKIEKGFPAVNGEDEQNNSIDIGDGKHPSAVDNDCAKCPSDVGGIAINHTSAVNVSADIHPDNTGKDHSDVSDDDGKHPVVHGVLSAVNDERVKNPSTVNSGNSKHLSAVDEDSGKCNFDASDDTGKHSAINNDVEKKVVSTVEDLKTINLCINVGDTKNSVSLEDGATIHASACNDDAGKHPSVLDAGNQPRAVNEDNPGKLPFAVNDDTDYHLSTQDNDAGKLHAVTDNTGKHPSFPDGAASDIDDARKQPLDANDNDSLDISFLDVKTNKLSWFELTEHEDEFDLFPVQTGFPKKAPENMTLSASQATVEEVQCDQAECQLENSKPSFEIQDSNETNWIQCQEQQKLGEREGEFDDLPELECLITAPSFVPEASDNVPKLDIAIDSNDGTHLMWTSDEPPPLIELVEDGPPPLLEYTYP